MKKFIAKHINTALVVMASGIMVADSLIWNHRPEVPAELLKK
jgi:cyclic lactone autoinducer peptide